MNSLWQEAFKKSHLLTVIFPVCVTVPQLFAAIHVLGWRWNTLCLLLLLQAEMAE